MTVDPLSCKESLLKLQISKKTCRDQFYLSVLLNACLFVTVSENRWDGKEYYPATHPLLCHHQLDVLR